MLGTPRVGPLGDDAPGCDVVSNAVRIVTPPGTAGAIDAVVNTTGGSATALGGFTYVSAPGI